MISLEQALASYADALSPLAPQRTPLEKALGHVLAEAVASRVHLPLFTQSAVDGYALRSDDTRTATAAAPAELELIGEVPAGAPAARAVTPGTAMRILTGGALPDGADTTARQEIVERAGDRIRLARPVAAGADTRVRGEELKAGDRLAEPGVRLHSGLIAALAMAGVSEVLARPRPRVAVLVTGDEIARVGATLAPGQVYDANGPLVSGWLVERGYGAPLLRYVPDRIDAVEAALRAALETADVVISTGGVSVGDRDYLPELAPRLGVRKVFWQVAQKPGKPLWFGARGHTAFIGLPGNPAAVLVGLAAHVHRVLGVVEGLAAPPPQWKTGVLNAPVKADAHRDRLVRMELRQDDEGRTQLTALPRQDSHMLSNLAAATALAWLPRREAGYAPGEVIRWIPLLA